MVKAISALRAPTRQRKQTEQDTWIKKGGFRSDLLFHICCKPWSLHFFSKSAKFSRRSRNVMLFSITNQQGLPTIEALLRSIAPRPFEERLPPSLVYHEPIYCFYETFSEIVPRFPRQFALCKG